MFYRIWVLILKELQQLWHSPQTRKLLIIPLLLQVLIFPFAATLEVKNSTLGIYDEDQSAPSIELTQRFSASSAFSDLMFFHDQASVQKAIDHQQVALVIHFPPDFAKQIQNGQSAQIQALMDGRSSNSAQIAYSYVQEIIMTYMQEIGLQKPLAQVVSRNAYNPNLHYYWFILPSLVAIIATFTCLIVSALSLAREREEGTFDQLLVTPLTIGYIMLGKAIPGILVGISQGAIIALIAVLFYKVPMSSSVLLLGLAMLCYTLAVVGVGLFITAFCSNQQQAFLGVFCYMVPSIILSGFLAPVENMPRFLYLVSRINPLSYMMEASQSLFMKYFSFTQLWPRLWPMLLIASATLTMAYTLFYKKTAT